MTENTTEKKKPGRPRTSADGTPKDKKLAIYLTSSSEADLKDLATIDGLTLAEFVSAILENEIAERAEDISDFRRIRARRKSFAKNENL